MKHTIHTFMKGKSSMEDIYTTVYDAMIKQGKPSIIGGDSAPGCAYRGDNNCKCGIGHIIPNKDMKKVLEMHNRYNVMPVDSILNQLNYTFNDADDNVIFLLNIQGCHDNAAWDGDNAIVSDEEFINRFKDEMEEIAFRNKLKV